MNGLQVFGRHDVFVFNIQFFSCLAVTYGIGPAAYLGDSEGSEVLIGEWVNEGCRLEMVMGNNDFFSSLDRELELELRGHRILLTHGHYYNVSLGIEGIYQEALDRECDIAMYGHTHRPFLEERGGITILNPGSLSYPRQEGRKPSYMIMYMEEDGSVLACSAAP